LAFSEFDFVRVAVTISALLRVMGWEEESDARALKFRHPTTLLHGRSPNNHIKYFSTFFLNGNLTLHYWFPQHPKGEFK
jgi:hypothetical protein